MRPLLLSACLAPCLLLSAAEADPANPPEIISKGARLDARCETPRLTIGTPGFQVWTIAGATNLDGAALPISWNLLDVAWVTYHGHDPDKFFPSGARHDPERDEILQPPVRLVLPGWNALVHPSGQLKPGSYACLLRVQGIYSPLSTIELLPPPDGVTPVPALTHAQVANVTRARWLDARILAEDSVGPGDSLGAELLNIPQYDPRVPLGTMWRGAVIEWVRLPKRPGEATLVWSPIQAGVSIPVARETGPQPEPPLASLPKLDIPVATALRDPLTGTVEPGLYKIRLAVCHATEYGFRQVLTSRIRDLRVLAPAK